MNDYTKNTLETLIPEVEVLNFIDANTNNGSNILVFEVLSELYKSRIEKSCLVSINLNKYKVLSYEDFLTIVKMFAKKNFKVSLYVREENNDYICTTMQLMWRRNGDAYETESGYVEIYRMNEKLFDYDIIKKFKVGEEDEENVPVDDSI